MQEKKENKILTFTERTQNNIYYQSKKIVVKHSCLEMGLGVFATEDIEEGEIIERAPMIQLELRRNYIHDSQLKSYSYVKSCDCDECKSHGVLSFLVLGYGMLYNHQDKPNAQWDFNYENLIGDLIAKKPIKKDEEIFIHYGNNYFLKIKKHTVN
jgi:hypothetical protein